MYTTNPRMPKIRRDVVVFAKKHGVRKAARHYGFHAGTVSKWIKKAKEIGLHPIPTGSSRPKRSPRKISEETRKAIVNTRIETKRCAEVVHKIVTEQGFDVSLSTVKRVLDRSYLIKKKSPWKRTHFSVPRPPVQKPGDLVQIDTIHLMKNERERIYVYTLIGFLQKATNELTVGTLSHSLGRLKGKLPSLSPCYRLTMALNSPRTLLNVLKYLIVTREFADPMIMLISNALTALFRKSVFITLKLMLLILTELLKNIYPFTTIIVTTSVSTFKHPYKLSTVSKLLIRERILYFK